MKINEEKFNKLLKAAVPLIYNVEDIPHIKELKYGKCVLNDGVFNDTRLYTVDSHTDEVSYNTKRIINELTEDKVKEIIKWAMEKINPIEE